MDPAQAREFLRTHHHAVLSTFRKDGHPQLSPVIVALDGTGRVVLSTTSARAKTRNLQRCPQVSACVFTSPFFGPWVHIEGTAEILPPALGLDREALVGLHSALSGEYPDWEAFNEGIHADGRVVIRFAVERASGITGR
ncbi:PPOX class F420-dependent oxidoreductase [Plantactinospora sp. KLBMP9567]|uniref:pyridoxamine 5'-phosphate oxidase family protein n=1 Tax=Plantactinospora sp. KLBMP9567 TaxID=3085900 RepID=UPI002981DCE0|nr:PPOX class F420-dependent oxidoreductase [Plantactinospora sp. KLBMP9567]MDW5322507.1 PPOX class F420-dependent oxidoreductase [Plantactinospora sp. KLBMP9567]